jgi:hypothetical protein
MLNDIVPRRVSTRRPQEPERESQFRRSVEERTQEEASPVEYPTDPEQVEPEGYYAQHGETTHAEPTRVIVVEAPADDPNWTDWTCDTLGVGPNGTQIGDAARRRTRFVVRNLDAVNPVFLSRQRTDVIGVRTVPALTEVEMLHNGPIYARSAVDGTQITYHAEYDIDDPD